MLVDVADLAGLDPVPVCVIGSGAAGVTVALALEDAGLDVLLLEAGGARSGDDDDLRGDLTQAAGHDPLERTRQRRLGGTSWQWGGRCVPLDDVDLEQRDWVPGSGWPVDRAAMQPWYGRAGELLRLGRPDWTRADALPDSRTDLVCSGPVTDDRVWRWSPPVRFWPDFKRRLSASSHIRVVPQAAVVRLEQERAGGPVAAAVVRLPEGREIAVRAGCFVVAAGGIETARLLLASTGSTPAGIGNGGDCVGRHYMVHPVAEVADVVPIAGLDLRGLATFEKTPDGVWSRRMLRVTDAAQRTHELRNAGFALWYPDPRDPAHGNGLLSTFALVRRALAANPRNFKATGVHRRYAEGGSTSAHLANVAGDLPAVSGYAGRWARDRWFSRRQLPAFTALPAGGHYRLRFDAEQSPDRDNRVTLATERDRLGMPRVAVRHLVGRDDRESIVRSLALVAAALERSGTARVILPPAEEIIDRLDFGDGTHQIGTARMSATPRTGVVDADCRVHDCPNLYLAGSAVFPTAGMAGPTLTIVALALRLAEHLVRTQAARARVGA